MANKELDFDEDIFDSMVNGTFALEDDEVEMDEEIIEDDSDDLDDDEDGEDNEDTDLEDADDEDEDLNELDDGEADEDSETEDDDEEENALVEDDDLDDEAGGEDDEAEEASEDGDTDESEDGTDTDEAGDGQAQATGTVDYKAFYDAVVNTEFTVNGRKSKGFSDPKKIIQSMQMAGGFSEKMAGFKKYRPYMAPLEERGMFADQSKFDLAMNIIDGDKEAIKKHLQTLDIDPLELDMESISYERKPATASEASMVVEDAVDRARNGGYEDKLRQVIGTEWDTGSFNEFISNPNVRSDLLDHIESGAYDKVTDKMAEMSRLDFNGTFGSLSSIAKYRAAVQQLQAEAPVAPAVPERVAPTKVDTASKVRAEKAAIEKSRKEEKYKQEIKVKEAKIAQQRKRAASMSKKKPKSKPATKFDPMKVEGEELDNLMEFLITGGR